MVNAFPLIMPCDLRALQHNMDPNKDVKNLSRWNVISWIMCIELDSVLCKRVEAHIESLPGQTG